MKVGLTGIHRTEGSLTLARIERKTPGLKPALQSNQSSLCHLRSSRDRGEDQMARSSALRKQLT